MVLPMLASAPTTADAPVTVNREMRRGRPAGTVTVGDTTVRICASGHAVPGTRVRLLSSPSKMPSRSWSMTAGKSCPMAVYTPDEHGNESICAHCYAMSRAYLWPVVVAALEARFDWARRAAAHRSVGDEFVATLTAAILGQGKPHFRVHDAGDLFSAAYIRLWIRICRACPDVAFWFPTRMWRSESATIQAALRELAALPNVALRPSALHFNTPAPVIPGYSAGTTAASAGFTCPASQQGNQCLDCRVCWDPTIEVSYRKH